MFVIITHLIIACKMESILGLHWTGCIGNPFIWLRNPLISLFPLLFLIRVGVKHFKVSSLIWIGLRIFRCIFCCLCFIGSSLGYLAACICEDWKGFLGFCSSKAAGCCFYFIFFLRKSQKLCTSHVFTALSQLWIQTLVVICMFFLVRKVKSGKDMCMLDSTMC